MKISGIIYDLDDTLISRDEAFYSGFTKKFYEKFVDKIKLGSRTDNGSVDDPDVMKKVSVGAAKKPKKAAKEK